METTEERPPLKPHDGTPLRPWKTDTRLRKQLFDLAEVVEVLLQIEGALKTDDPGISWASTWLKYIDITPKDDAHARRIVGKLIRAFKAKPKIAKPNDSEMESVWTVSGVIVTVKGYMQKTCRYEEIDEEVPEQPERTETVVHAAVPAHTRKKRVIVCDDVAAKIEDAEHIAAGEVPF